jgi:DNA-binding NarL/FixJ family response regulator
MRQRRRFTPTELKVLELMAKGHSNRGVATVLHPMALSTVKTHVHDILQKLRLENRTRVAVWYIHHKDEL